MAGFNLPSLTPGSVMQHSFSRVPQVKMPRSTFKRDHSVTTTFDAGLLIPIFYDEVYPGDTHSLTMSADSRLNTPIYPIMDNMHLDTFFFFVPYRLIWENFPKFMKEQENPGDSTDYQVPRLAWPPAGFDPLTLEDYLGWPLGIAPNTYNLAVWAHRAYNFIWNEFFRDQNLQDAVDQIKTDGPDIPTSYTLLRRGKRHDYFTTCLPWPQKGEEVLLPLGTTAPVFGNDLGLQISDGSTVYSLAQAGSNNLSGTTAGLDAGDASSGFSATANTVYGIATSSQVSDSGAYADLTDATASTINNLREAIVQQQAMEIDARSGTRYIEKVFAHFGVINPDFRLQRPEYIGGGSTPISIVPIAQTSETGTTPQGTLGAVGFSQSRGTGFNKSFTEHGIILGLASVRADLRYQRGVDHMWTQLDYEDFYLPCYANIGEQAVLNREIYADGTSDDLEVFGYQEAWAHLRYKNSLITGQMRSTHPTSLDVWHLAEDFGESRPLLNADYIQDNPPIDRVVATPDEPHFNFTAFYRYRSTRVLPIYSIPGLSRL